MSPRPRLTILTASWDRAHLLGRLHASLMRQPVAHGQVEWLVVDDGSTDETHAELARLSAQPGTIPMRYVRQPHGGKHRALNTGFAAAHGDWIAVIDSDDWCRDNALPAVLALLDQIAQEDVFAAILPLIVPKAARQYCFRQPDRALTYTERANTEPAFDCTLIFRRDTDGLRFPEFPKEDFLAEAALLFQLGRDRRVWLSNHVLVEAEYQPDGLSAHILRKRMASPVGACHGYQVTLACRLRPALRLRTLANYGRFWWHAQLRRSRPPAPASLPQGLALLPGALFYLIDVAFSAARR
ncbi:Beta-monoglucosyldiacylglycerol synthase [Roseibaca ekhonensis]|uniref:Beta-monoglucosyldiacylglycerol synthase n=1 Tax=Roseinatronobacter ekhonensis TaxID=254356 RepID=A0A3B0M8T1_9RHOB|nr:glycosyltransferase family 2 protein [Roseibaca ekhonensis]SUZ32345.1 Beta-monoglucosyldiacylglycerol synthase [Roseibaca ekhonensis]